MRIIKKVISFIEFHESFKTEIGNDIVMSIRRFYNIVSIDEALELLQLNMKEYFIYEIYN